MNLQEFFAMGGYGIYIWSAYALTVLLLSLNIVLPWRRHRRLLQDIRTRHQRSQQLQREKHETST
jgi:heme exporter protein D